jgi:serine/threonine-protein kinase
LLVLATAAPWAAAAAPVGGVDAALAWLASVDHGAYARSWADSGTLFRSHLSDAEWAKIVKPTREPLGAVKSRTLASETTTSSLPGAPDGHYEIVRFSTEFAAKHAAVETVVLTDEPTGWKVDGYFIK